MRFWELFIRLFSSPGRLIAFCWRSLFIRERRDDEEALINSVQVGPKRKALLLGVTRCSMQEPEIKGPYADVKGMQQVLIDIYDYKPKDITVLINNGSLEPTEENIIREMGNLVADARPGDRFFFLYAGHGDQLPDDNGDEEDGWDECIITSDGVMIRDDKLKEVMLDQLPPGCSFVSVLDACHSGTLLDLTHYRCNRVYVPWVSKRKMARSLSDGDIVNYQTVNPQDGHLMAHPTTLSAQEVARVYIPESSDLPRHCHATCIEDPYFMEDVEPMADVISLSAAKDYQISWSEKDSSLTQALIQVLRRNKNPSISYLLKAVSHKLHKFYVEKLHPDFLEYERRLEIKNSKRRMEGKALKQGKTRETENFQDPQISSHRPLSKDKKWEL